MGPFSLNLVCTLMVQGIELQLSVQREGSELWLWKLADEKGVILKQGIMPSRLAAQVAVQRAFEHRLQRAGINNLGFTGYRWREVVD